MEETLLTIENLSAWYKKENKVLSGFSVELKGHEVVGLIGLNGAGKTTFLKVLSGLHNDFDCDEIRFHGHFMKFRDKEFKTSRYTVFAEEHSFSYFTFMEYLSYVFAAYGQKPSDITALIRGFHFEENRDVLLKDLSTGSRKKAFLITAFALRPELLLLDEPVNGLDFESTEFLYQMLKAYKAYGTVLFSSHVLESLTLVADRVLVLAEGKIRQSFGSEEIDANHIRTSLQMVI